MFCTNSVVPMVPVFGTQLVAPAQVGYRPVVGCSVGCGASPPQTVGRQWASQKHNTDKSVSLFSFRCEEGSLGQMTSRWS